MHETGVDENDGEDWADYDYDEMVPMVIVMSVVAMVMLKRVQNTTPLPGNAKASDHDCFVNIMMQSHYYFQPWQYGAR